MNSSCPAEKLSHPTTCAPTASNRSTTVLPMKPAAPVTKNLCMRCVVARTGLHSCKNVSVSKATRSAEGLIIACFLDAQSDSRAAHLDS